MFTGIIEAVGRVAAVEPLTGARRLTLETPFAAELQVDQSIAVNGVCLTAVAVTPTTFTAVAIEETLSKTNLGDLVTGSVVNLERALQPGRRLDGHFVMGHVDATGTVRQVTALADSWLIEIGYPPDHAPYLIPVGSVALDGVSLTVARLTDDALTVAIIPYTWAHTSLSTWEPGRRVNLEFDLIGKYVVRALERGIGAGPLQTGGTG